MSCAHVFEMVIEPCAYMERPSRMKGARVSVAAVAQLSNCEILFFFSSRSLDNVLRYCGGVNNYIVQERTPYHLGVTGADGQAPKQWGKAC